MQVSQGPKTGRHLLRHEVTAEVRAAAVSCFGEDQQASALAIWHLRQPELRQKFSRVYNVESTSCNNEWMRGKLLQAVGLHSQWRPSEQQPKGSSAASNEARGPSTDVLPSKRQRREPSHFRQERDSNEAPLAKQAAPARHNLLHPAGPANKQPTAAQPAAAAGTGAGAGPGAAVQPLVLVVLAPGAQMPDMQEMQVAANAAVLAAGHPQAGVGGGAAGTAEVSAAGMHTEQPAAAVFANSSGPETHRLLVLQPPTQPLQQQPQQQQPQQQQCLVPLPPPPQAASQQPSDIPTSYQELLMSALQAHQPLGDAAASRPLIILQPPATQQQQDQPTAGFHHAALGSASGPHQQQHAATAANQQQHLGQQPPRRQQQRQKQKQDVVVSMAPQRLVIQARPCTTASPFAEEAGSVLGQSAQEEEEGQQQQQQQQQRGQNPSFADLELLGWSMSLPMLPRETISQDLHHLFGEWLEGRVSLSLAPDLLP